MLPVQLLVEASNTKKAVEDRTIEFARMNSTQAATEISEGLRGMSDEYQKAVQVLQILQKIQDAMRVGY